MSIFLASSNSSNSLNDLRRIAMLIEEVGLVLLPWYKVGLFPLGHYTAESLRYICKTVDAAILLFNEDDLSWYRNDYHL